jgi:hypothetical protein
MTNLWTQVRPRCWRAGYRQAGAWAGTPALPVASFVRSKAALLSGGLIDRDFPFDRIVDADLSRADPA